MEVTQTIFQKVFLEKLDTALIKVEEVLNEGDKLLTQNKIFVDRVKNIGIISKEKAISFGFSGPMLRACGIAQDLRVAEGGYSIYPELDFDIPVGEQGDCYDRYLVRMEEIRQSISIIRQASQKIPEGDFQLRNRKTSLPEKKDVYGNIEGLIDHFKIIMDGHCPPAGETYTVVEGANGELGFYVVSDGTGTPVKCRCRPPCFNFVAALREMCVGYFLADVVAIFGSVNMIGGELDR